MKKRQNAIIIDKIHKYEIYVNKILLNKEQKKKKVVK